MFSRTQLELLQSILEADHNLDPATIKELRGAVASALWQQRHLSAKDKKLIAEAEAAGRINVYERAQSGLPGWTMASKIQEKIDARGKLPDPAITEAKDGDDLLAALGI